MDTTIQKTPVAGVGGAITNTGIISQDGITPITSESLQPVKPVSIPSPYVSTAADSILGTTGAMKDNLTAQLQADEKAKQASTETSKNDLTTLRDQILGVQTSQIQAEKDAGLDTKKATLLDVTKQIEESDRSLQNEIKAVEARGDITKEAAQGLIGNLKSKAASYQADLYIKQAAVNRDITSAQSAIDRKIELQLAPLKTNLEFAKMFYQDNKEALTASENKQFQYLINKNDKEYQKAAAFETQRGNLQLQAIKDGNMALFNALGKATDSASLANITYQNIVPEGGKTKAQTIAESIFQGNSGLNISELPIAQRAEVTAELNRLKQTALSSGDITGVIKASAGGKQVSDTFTQSFEKALNVVGQLDELKANIAKVKTGPILGIIRSNNPYDTKAQEIKAQLQAIVPNLARGIYGEVGVLTDNDVALYAKTIANLNSTEEVNDAIMGMTVRSVQRSLENKIKTQAGFGRDVSGILSTYQDIKSLSDSMLSPTSPKTTYEGVILPGDTTTSTTYQGINLPN